jgi:hypothetical protein
MQNGVSSLALVGCSTFSVSDHACSEVDRSIQPASLKWQSDGELSQQDVFNLVCQLRAVEPGHTCNELWRLGQKYPKSTPADAR